MRIALGELAMTRGDYGEALRALTLAAKGAERPALGLVEHRLGELHRLLGRFDLADEHFTRALRTHPQPSVVHADRALLYHRLGVTDRALEEAANALRSSAGIPALESRAHNVSGVVTDDDGTALEHLDHALHLAGEDPLARVAALNNKAHILARVGDSDTAIDLVKGAIEIAASTGYRHQQAALHNHLADLHHQSGRAQLAAEELTRAVELFADIDAGAWQPEVWLLTQW